MKVLLRPVSIHPLGRHAALLYSDGCPPLTLPTQMARAVASCQVFRTRAAHRAELLRRGLIVPQQVAELDELFERLDQLGFLLTEATLCRLGRDNRSTSIRIDTLAALSRGPHHAAWENVRSYLENAAASGRRMVCLVDDHASAGASLDAVSKLACHGSRLGVEVRVAGRRERQLYAECLAREADIPLAIVLALLEDAGPGSRAAQANAVLLDTIGRAVFCFDDASSSRTSRLAPGDAGDGVEIASSDLPRVWAFPDPDSLLRRASPETCDLIGEHERWLGQLLSTVISCVPTVSLTDADADLAARIVARRARVVATASGTYGTSDRPTEHHLLLGGEERQDLLQGKEHYERCAGSRQAWRAVRKATITRDPHFQTVAFGVDNREVFPPFLPFAGESDTRLVRAALEHRLDHCVAHLPTSVLRVSSPDRPQPGDGAGPSTAAQRFELLVDLCLTSYPRALMHGEVKEEPLQRLGRHMSDLGSRGADELRTLLTPFLVAKYARSITRLEQALEEHAFEPQYWARDVRRAISTLERALHRPDPLALGEDGPEDHERKTARPLRTLGQAVTAWPAMRAAALRMSDRGLRPSRPILGRHALAGVTSAAR
jgi:hypothetical protein